MNNGLIIDGDGNKRWYLNDQLHRLDGPAIELSDGRIFWYVNGKEHIVDQTAEEMEEWYQISVL